MAWVMNDISTPHGMTYYNFHTYKLKYVKYFDIVGESSTGHHGIRLCCNRGTTMASVAMRYAIEDMSVHSHTEYITYVWRSLPRHKTCNGPPLRLSYRHRDYGMVFVCSELCELKLIDEDLTPYYLQDFFLLIQFILLLMSLTIGSLGVLLLLPTELTYLIFVLQVTAVQGVFGFFALVLNKGICNHWSADMLPIVYGLKLCTYKYIIECMRPVTMWLNMNCCCQRIHRIVSTIKVTKD